MVSNKFLELAGYLRDVDRWRPMVQAKIARKPAIFLAIAIICLAIIGVLAIAYMTLFEQGFIWYGAFALGGFAIIATFGLWAGPFGLQQQIFEQERQVRIGYREARLKLEASDPRPEIIVFGIGPIKKGQPLTLVEKMAILVPKMLTRETVKEDLRLPLGDYSYLGIAFAAEGDVPDIDHPDLMKQLWVRDALKQGFTEDEVLAFVRSLKLTTLDWS